MTEKELDFELNAAAMPVNSIAWGANDFVIPADKAIEILKKQQAKIEDLTRIKDTWVQVFLPMTEYCEKEKIGSLGQSFVGAFIDSHSSLREQLAMANERETQLNQRCDALLSTVYNHCIGEVTMNVKVDAESLANEVYEITGINAEQLRKMGES